MTTLAPSLRFVPIGLGAHAHGLTFCVALQPEAAAGSDPLVLLRSDLGTRVYLGASLDAGRRVVEWLEIWVQSVSGLAESPATWRDYLTNAQLDAQWSLNAQRFAATTPDSYRHTGWESAHATPLFIDLAEGEPWVPTDVGSGEPYRLCTDDAKLTAAGLPAYSRSLHRYWIAQSGDGRGASWVAITAGAPLAPS